MALLNRLRAALVAALILLTVGLAAAVTLGILFRPVPPLAYPDVTVTTIDHHRGTGQQVLYPIQVTGRAVGITIACQGSGLIAVTLTGLGRVETSCTNTGADSGGFVLSDLQDHRYVPGVRTAARNRWSVVFTQPTRIAGTLQP